MNSNSPSPLVLWAHLPVDDDSDCACPVNGIAFQTGELQVGRDLWQKTRELYTYPLPGPHTLVFQPDGPVPVVVLDAAAKQILDVFAGPLALSQAVRRLPHLTPAHVQRAARQMASVGLLHPVFSPVGRCPSAGVQGPPTSLTAWLHLTNACNLHCTYCYLRTTDEVMDEATGKAAVDAVFRSAVQHGFRVVKLKYAGGEPTLNFSLVRVLHEHAQRRAEETGLQLREVILSNGVGLTQAMLEFIYDAGMRLSISLDGIGAGHDAQRVFFNGRGTAALVERSVERALACGVRPYLSITVTVHNVDTLPEVVEFALHRNLLFNLNFYREHGPQGSFEDLRVDNEHLIAGLRRAFAVIEEHLPPYPLIGALVDRANFSAPHTHACGAGHTYLVIDQNGRIARCQMEIERPVTSVFAPDPLAEVRLYDDGWQNLSVEQTEECQGCPWRYWCGGGCPLLTYRVSGRSDVKSPYCRVYKAIFPDLLRLEGLRLLKWQGGALGREVGAS